MSEFKVVEYFTSELARTLVNCADINMPRAECSLDIAEAVLALMRAELDRQIPEILRKAGVVVKP